MDVRDKHLPIHGRYGGPWEISEFLKWEIRITNKDGGILHTIFGKKGSMGALGFVWP